MLKKFGFILCSALLFVACGDTGGGGGGGGGVSGAVDDYNDASKGAVESECECRFEDLGYSDASECVDQEHSDVSLTSCQEQAAQCDSSSYNALLGCQTDAANAFTSCMSTCSDDPAIYSDCRDTYVTETNECNNHISDTLQTAFAECANGASAPSCASSSSNNGGTNNGGTNNGGTNNGGTNNGGGSVDQSFDSAMAKGKDFIETLCSCYWEASGQYNSQQDCVDQNYSSSELTSCQREVANCDTNEFSGFMGCLGSAFSDYDSCISSCPAQAQLESCGNSFESSLQSCRSQYQQLTEAMDACDSTGTASCP